MPVNVSCTGCGTAFSVDDALAGKKIRCKSCQAVMQVPAGRPAAAARPGSSSSVALPRPKPPAEEDVEDALEDAEEEAARPARRGKAKPKAAGNLPLVVGGAVVAVALVVAVAATVAFSGGEEEQPKPVATAKPDEPKPPSPPEGNQGFGGGNPFGGPPAKVEPKPPEPKADPKPPEPKAEPPKADPPPPPKVEPPTPVAPPRPAGDGSLTKDILDRIKRSTVYIGVNYGDGVTGSGSGFFALDQGIVLTNAHVVGMLGIDSKPPDKMDIVLNKGEQDERVMSNGEVIGVQRETDLAVIRLRGVGLPPPLPIIGSDGVFETQPVFTVGFPYGELAGKEVSVRKSTVSSLRREYGELKAVSLEGGADPGNSGGPVIDDRGRVIGVTVSKITGSTIAYAIPGDEVLHVVNGQIDRLEFGQAYKADGGTLKVPVTARVVDPLRRLKEAAVVVWSGPTGAARRGGAAEPEAAPGDTARVAVALERKDDRYAGEVTLPTLAAGQAWWFTSKYVGGADGKQVRWRAARTYAPEDPPVERKPVTLDPQVARGEQRVLTVTSKQRLGSRGVQAGTTGRSTEFAAEITETVQSVDQIQVAYQWQYRTYKASQKVNNSAKEPTKAAYQREMLAKDLGAVLKVTRDGELKDSRASITRLPPDSREEMRKLNTEVMQAFETAALPVPKGALAPGQTWVANRSLGIALPGRFALTSSKLTYTYHGVAQREGREEAVVTIEGALEQHGSEQVRKYLKASGRVSGKAAVDVLTGTLVRSELTTDIQVEASFPELPQPIKNEGTLTVGLRRGPAAGGR